MPKLLRIRQDEAQTRNQARAKRTPEQQLKLLDQRPGNSTRERARLEARIAAAAAKPAPKAPPAAEPAPKAKKPRAKAKKA
jgi:hypothetical protein